MKRYYRPMAVILCLAAILIYANYEIEKVITLEKQKKAVESTEKKKEVKTVVVPIKVAASPQPLPEPVQPQPQMVEKKPQSSTDSAANEMEGDSDPAVLATYAMPVEDYLHFMFRHGAQVGIYDTARKEFVCAVDKHGKFLKGIRMNGMSSRARRITADFPGGRSVVQLAVRQFGPSSYEILLLLPEQMDNRFYRNLEKTLAASGKNKKEISLIRVTYVGNASSIKVQVNSFEGENTSIKVAEKFYL